MKALRIQVYGRVQGVGFRYFTIQAARRYEICGWVRNEADGSVSIYAVGHETRLLDFLGEIHKGPSYSRVTDVQIKQADFEEEGVPEVFDVAY